MAEENLERSAAEAPTLAASERLDEEAGRVPARSRDAQKPMSSPSAALESEPTET